EIGVDAARWYLVNRGPDQTIDIDVDLAAERSQKNPVYYVQYAHARIAGILRNAGGAEVSASPVGALAGEESEIVKRLLEMPSVADGWLHTQKQRARSVGLRLAAGLGPTLVLVVAAAALGGGAAAVAIAVLGVLCGLVIVTSARTVRGALIAGVVVAVLLFLL